MNREKYLLLGFYILLMGCAESSQEGADYSNFTGELSQYEREIQSTADHLYTNGRIVSADSNVRNILWTMTWDSTRNKPVLQMHIGNETKTYNFANRVLIGGRSAFIVPSQEDLRGLGNNQSNYVRVLQINNSMQEIRGSILLADNSMFAEIRNALTTQSPLINNTASTEAFFRLTFARAAHSYSYLSAAPQVQELLDPIMQERQVYIVISSLHWARRSGNIPSSNTGALNTNNIFNRDSGVLSYLPQGDAIREGFSYFDTTSYATGNSDVTLEGKIDFYADLYSVVDTRYRVINLHFKQSARDFHNPGQFQNVNVLLAINYKHKDASVVNLRSTLRRKNLAPLNFLFEFSASMGTNSARINLEISRLTAVNPFQRSSFAEGYTPIAHLLESVGGNLLEGLKKIGGGIAWPFKRLMDMF